MLWFRRGVTWCVALGRNLAAADHAMSCEGCREVSGCDRERLRVEANAFVRRNALGRLPAQAAGGYESLCPQSAASAQPRRHSYSAGRKKCVDALERRRLASEPRFPHERSGTEEANRSKGFRSTAI